MTQIEKTLGQLARYVGAQLLGDPQCVIKGLGSLQSAIPGQLSFLDNPVYRKFLPTTKASAVILSATDVSACPCNALVVDDPYFTYAKIAELFIDSGNQPVGIHPSAIIGNNCHIDPTAIISANVVIEDNSTIGANTMIAPGTVVGRNCSIGADCQIAANVTLYHNTQIGHRVIIHSGAVVGADGFGIAEKDGVWFKVPQLGRAIIHDDVEIGANTTIDRGALSDTVIEKGVKLDNQIQIGHNVHIGEHTAIAACTGVAGSTQIGKHCKIAGGVGINGHLEIADYSVITGMAMVTNSIKVPGIYSSGTGVMSNQEWKKNVARFRQLDRLFKRFSSAQEKTNNHFEKPPIRYGKFESAGVPAITDKVIGINEIFKYIPQRPPFLLIDRVIKFTPEKSLTAIKNLTINESYFQGHFPGKPIMPGVLILEALAQACTVFAFMTTGENPQDGGIYYFAGIDNARFKRPVEPGDQLVLDVEFIKRKRGLWKMKGVASVGGEIVCNAELLSAKPNNEVTERLNKEEDTNE
jgi:UDP-3-O-[3-hydroxymyristoyl] glucosamine N-acyltransferase